MSVCKYSASLI